MIESLRELAAKRLSELAVKHERLRQDIAEAEDRLARLEGAASAKQAELEKATAALKDRRREHQEVEASFQSMRKEKGEMRRILYDDPPRSFLEGLGRQA
jgi:hypothetical protein